MKLVIGNKNYSSWSLRPWLLMQWHKLDFQEEHIGLFRTGYQQRIKHFSKAGLVPVLIDGDAVIWDSLAICEYISEQYLGGGGWPNSTKDRALARSCAAEMHSGFTAVRNHLPMNIRAENRQIKITQELEKEINRIESMWSDLLKKYSDLGPWLMGEFSIVDCMYIPMLFRFNTYGIRLNAMCNAYQTFAIKQEFLQPWVHDAIKESGTIDYAEVGIKE